MYLISDANLKIELISSTLVLFFFSLTFAEMREGQEAKVFFGFFGGGLCLFEKNDHNPFDHNCLQTAGVKVMHHSSAQNML